MNCRQMHQNNAVVPTRSWKRKRRRCARRQTKQSTGNWLSTSIQRI